MATTRVEDSKMKLPPAPPPDAVKFCQFVTASPTPFHAVHNLTRRLLSAGFHPISERSPDLSSFKAGSKLFYTRNQSSLVAFTLPASPASAISFAVGHLDSPCLKVRPVSKKEKEGYLQVATEVYGGGIWLSWLDRDLSLAGRAIVAGQKGFESRLVKIDRPILRIPTLAIHLDRSINDSFKFNKETEFRPVIGLLNEALNAKVGSTSKSPSATDEAKGSAPTDIDMGTRHHPLMLSALAEELGCEIADIHDFELSLYDTQPSCVGGLSNEFIFSPRIDNLMTCFASIEALCDASGSGENVNCVMLFDNEEVGSVSNHGAESNLLPAFVERIASLPDYKDMGVQQFLSNSFLLSADMSHAINPNYDSKYEKDHAPHLNGGVVIKTNANQKYTSTSQTTFFLRQIAKRAGIPTQEFEVRNDSTCGSTIGPHLSTHVRTVDIGLAQLSMHSIRETSGSADVESYIKLFKTYFETFASIDKELSVDAF